MEENLINLVNETLKIANDSLNSLNPNDSYTQETPVLNVDDNKSSNTILYLLISTIVFFLIYFIICKIKFKIILFIYSYIKHFFLVSKPKKKQVKDTILIIGPENSGKTSFFYTVNKKNLKLNYFQIKF